MFRLIIFAVLSLTAIGCVTATVVEKERVDMGVSGNQGYLAGEVPESAESSHRTREVVQIDVELPVAPEMRSVKRFSWGKLLFWKRRAEEIGSPTEVRVVEVMEVEEVVEELASAPYVEPEVPKTAEEVIVKRIEESKETEEKKEKLVTVYTVGKNESLWNIAAKEEIYGNPVKWTKIYEANRDKIGNPNKIKDGMVLKIPRD